MENVIQENGLTFWDLLNIIRKRLAWIIVIPFLAAAVTYVYTSYTHVDRFATDVTVFIKGQETENAAQQASIGLALVKDYQELVHSRLVLHAIESQVGIPAEQLDDMIEVTNVPNTRILKITVTDTVPERAVTIANLLQTTFIQRAKETMKLSTVEPIDVAGEPRLLPSHIFRNTALAWLLGVVVVIGLSLAIEILDTTIRTEDDINRRLGANLLGIIPRHFKKKSMAKYRDLPAYKKYQKVEGYVREAVNTACTNILYSGADQEIKSVVFTSVTPNEGKTTTAIFTAIAMAEQGKRVCIVDCDLRRPLVMKYLGLKNAPGVTDVVGHRVSLSDTIIRTDVPNLYAIDAGSRQPNQTEVLSSKRFEKMAQVLAEEFDFVIFDSTPLGSFIDSALVSIHTDGVILVIEHGRVRFPYALKVIDQIHKVGSRILGVIVNNVDLKGTQYGYYGYYGHYGYYGYQQYNQPEQRRGREDTAAGAGSRKKDEDVQDIGILHTAGQELTSENHNGK